VLEKKTMERKKGAPSGCIKTSGPAKTRWEKDEVHEESYHGRRVGEQKNYQNTRDGR
jgi:hypothetical protein